MKPTAEQFDILVRPIVTEKSTGASEHRTVVFETRVDASKPTIKAAVEAIFGVKVDKVNTVLQKGKTKSFRGRQGRRKDIKKAYVKLAEGNAIDIGGRI